MEKKTTKRRLNQIPEARIKLAYNEPISEDSLDSPRKVVAWIQEMIGDEAQELFVVVYLNSSLQVLNYSIIGKGGATNACVSPAEIFKVALLSNATRIILFHNHPSGNPEPSGEDILITRKIVTLGKMLEIKVVEHLIVTMNSVTSLCERGLIDDEDDELAKELREDAKKFNEKYALKVKGNR